MNNKCDGGWMEGTVECPNAPVAVMNCQSYGQRHLCEEHKWLSERLCAEAERGAKAYGRGIRAQEADEKAMMR